MHSVFFWRYKWWQGRFTDLNTKPDPQSLELSLSLFLFVLFMYVCMYLSLDSVASHPTLRTSSSISSFLSSDNYSLSESILQDSISVSETASWPSILFSCILSHSQATFPSFTHGQWEWPIYVPSQTHKNILCIIPHLLYMCAGWTLEGNVKMVMLWQPESLGKM